MVKKIAIGLLLLTGKIYADSTTVSADTGFGTASNPAQLFDNPALHGGSDVALSGGTTADGDGDVIQIGYFDQATTGNNFLGNFVPLTGETSLNTAIVPGSVPAEGFNHTSIGDVNGNGGGTGTIFIGGLSFVVGDSSSGNNLPPSQTIPLAIRIFNGTTIAGSTFFNVVSDDLWTWKTPAAQPPNVALSLDDPGLEWLSIANSQPANTAFHTTISLAAVPEPSSLALLGIGLIIVPLARRVKR